MKTPAAAALLVVLLAGCPKFHSGKLRNPPADAAFIEVDGVHMRYLDVGEGPVVVLLHGYGSAIESWHAIIPALKANHRVIAVDLKGFGWSSRPPGDYSPPAHAALLWHLLDKRGVTDVALVGHSWGASVALAMTLARPARVRRIALFSAYVYEAQIPSFFHWARTSVGEMLFALYYRERVEERLPLAFADNRFVTALLVDRTESALERPGTVAAALATARGQRYSAIEKRYRSIVKPVLLLWGRDDIVTPLNFGERLAEDLPNARLEVLPRCGHIPMIEAANASSRALVAFLGETETETETDSDSGSDTEADTEPSATVDPDSLSRRGRVGVGELSQQTETATARQDPGRQHGSKLLPIPHPPELLLGKSSLPLREREPWFTSESKSTSESTSESESDSEPEGPPPEVRVGWWRRSSNCDSDSEGTT